MGSWEDKTRWEVRKREQFQKERRAGKYRPRYLICDLDEKGKYVEDSRGRRYLLAVNKYGKRGGLFRVGEAEEALLKEKGYTPRKPVHVQIRVR